MAFPRKLVEEVRRLDQYDLRRMLILVRGLLLELDGPPAGDVDEVVPGLRVTYRQEYVRCGKVTCTSCPHGPYWYGYWKEEGRTRKQYIGRHLPGQMLEPVIPEGQGSGGTEPRGSD